MSRNRPTHRRKLCRSVIDEGAARKFWLTLWWREPDSNLRYRGRRRACGRSLRAQRVKTDPAKGSSDQTVACLGLPKKTRKDKPWETAGKRHKPGDPLTIEGHPVPIAGNYVVFSTPADALAVNPPVIATYYKGEPTEYWHNTPISRAIKPLVIRNNHRCLRIPNKQQQPHRHIHYRNIEEAKLKEILTQLRESVT